jgi:phosphate transport system substrate-binding protein
VLMQKHRRRLAMLALPLSLVLLAAACGGDDDDSASTGSGNESSGSEAQGQNLSGEITGSGSSFQDAFQQEVIGKFADVEPNLTVTYNAVGSGQGKEEFGNNLTNFAGTDSLVKPGDGPAEGSFLYIPIAAAPITVSYNLPDVDKLQLSAETLAKIFQGDIKKWNDAAIKADNPDATLPSTAIVIAHRSDGSGTTSNFTKYLDSAAKGTWTLGSGDTVEWPSDSQAGEKNTGVAQIISDTEGAIGYVDLSDADAAGLTYASIKNKAGDYEQPTIDGAAKAMEGATVADDVTFTPLDIDGAGVYPITSPTYDLIRTKYKDQKTLDNVKGYFTYLLGDGQDLAEGVSFAKLPDSLKQKALAQLDKPTVG